LVQKLPTKKRRQCVRDFMICTAGCPCHEECPDGCPCGKFCENETPNGIQQQLETQRLEDIGYQKYYAQSFGHGQVYQLWFFRNFSKFFEIKDRNSKY